MEKTALTQLIEILQKNADFINDDDSIEDRYARQAYRDSIKEATELLAKEKQQIAEAYGHGIIDGITENDDSTNGNDYYNGNFGKPA